MSTRACLRTTCGDCPGLQCQICTALIATQCTSIQAMRELPGGHLQSRHQAEMLFHVCRQDQLDHGGPHDHLHVHIQLCSSIEQVMKNGGLSWFWQTSSCSLPQRMCLCMLMSGVYASGITHLMFFSSIRSRLGLQAVRQYAKGSRSVIVLKRRSVTTPTSS